MNEDKNAKQAVEGLAMLMRAVNQNKGENQERRPVKIILEIPNDLIKISSTEKIVKVYKGASYNILSTLYLDHIEPDGQIIFKSPLLEYYLDNYPDARERTVE